jgi:hypothetical protein
VINIDSNEADKVDGWMAELRHQRIKLVNGKKIRVHSFDWNEVEKKNVNIFKFTNLFLTVALFLLVFDGEKNWDKRWKYCKEGGVTNIHLPRYLFQVIIELEGNVNGTRS